MKAFDALTSMGNTPGAVTAGPKVAPVSTNAAEVSSLTPREPSPQDMQVMVRSAVQQIDSYLKSVGREVEFHVDDATGMTVVTVRSTATGDLIRQIPNEEVLQLARHLNAASGTLLSLTA